MKGINNTLRTIDLDDINEAVVFVKGDEVYPNESARKLADYTNKKIVAAVKNDLIGDAFNLIKLFEIESGVIFRVDERATNIDDIHEKVLTDYLKLSHDNVLLWRLEKAVLLNQSLDLKVKDFINNLVLDKIIKLTSSFLIDFEEKEVIGKKASYLFELNDANMEKGISDFFLNDLFINNVELKVKSPLVDKSIISKINLKGYQEEGMLTYVLLTSQDISEAHYKNEQYSLTKSMLNDAEIVGKQAAFVFWPNSGKVWWSDNNYQLYGIKDINEEAKNKIKNMSCILPEYHVAIRNLIDNAKEGSESKQRFKVKRLDGEIRDFEMVCTKNYDSFVDDYRINGLIRDITDEVKLSEQIKAKSEAWERYADSVPGAFYSYLIDKNGVASVGYYNQKLIELAGLPNDCTVENVLERYISNIHPDDLDTYYSSIEKAVISKTKWENKHRLKQLDGSYKWIRGLASPSTEDSDYITFYGILIDVTDEENQTKALNLANHKYALATQAARMGIWELDLATNTLELDQQLKHIYHLSDNHLKKIHFNDWLNYAHDNYKSGVKNTFSAAIKKFSDIDITYKVVINEKEYFHNILGLVISDNSNKATKVLGVTRDVTEIMSYQNELKNINNIYELATKSANLGIWEWNLENGKLIWNDSHYELFNITKESENISYEEWEATIHKDDVEQVKVSIQNAIANGSAKIPTYKAIVKDKGVCYFEAACTTIYDETNTAVRMLGVVWEVTDNIKQQKEIEDTNIKYKLATKTARMGIWDLDIITNEINWDQELHQIFNTKAENNVTYEKWQNMLHPEDRDRLSRHLALAIKGERDYNEVFRHKRTDGNWAYNKSRAVVLKNDIGEPIRVLGVSWDVSDMIQYQKNLESLNLKYRLATKSIRIGLWDYNPKTNRVIWDPALAEMYGIPNSFEESLPIEQILHVIDEKDRARFHKSFKNAIANKWLEFNESYTVNNPITGKNRHIEIVCGPQFDDDGNIERMLGLSFDNTEVVERELELVKVLETREKLFNVIAHDLKGPISNLIGVSEFLTNDYDSLSDAEIKEFLLMIRKSSLTASNLMNNLITWTRNISNRIPFKPEFKSTKKYFTTALSFYEETLKLKGIYASIDVDCYTGKIFADINMMDTILRNLLGNAIKFSSKGDSILLTAKKEANNVIFVVADSGIGMSEAQIKMILNQDGKFQRTGTSKEKGTGLGLIIVQDFIEKHNGKFTITSTENEGSIFTISLPQP